MEIRRALNLTLFHVNLVVMSSTRRHMTSWFHRQNSLLRYIRTHSADQHLFNLQHRYPHSWYISTPVVWLAVSHVFSVLYEGGPVRRGDQEPEQQTEGGEMEKYSSNVSKQKLPTSTSGAVLGFSILPKDTLTCRPGQSNQRPSHNQMLVLTLSHSCPPDTFCNLLTSCLLPDFLFTSVVLPADNLLPEFLVTSCLPADFL